MQKLSGILPPSSNKELALGTTPILLLGSSVSPLLKKKMYTDK
jgi:hypothetical protein